MENECNIVWFLERCHDSGITLQGRAVFCDRDQWRGIGVRINLRYCTVHLMSTMKKAYGYVRQVFENAIWKIQGAEKQVEFAAALAKLRSNYGDPVANYVSSIFTDLGPFTQSIPLRSRAESRATHFDTVVGPTALSAIVTDSAQA